MLKHCGGCDRNLPLTAFHANRVKKGGHQTQCKKCIGAAKKTWNDRNRDKTAGYQRTYFQRHPDRVRQRARAYGDRIREEGYAALGGCCACCGETEPAFLTVDHVNGRTPEDSFGSQLHMLLWLRKEGYPEGYRLLCFNCNCGRERNGGVCPHELVREEVA